MIKNKTKNILAGTLFVSLSLFTLNALSNPPSSATNPNSVSIIQQQRLNQSNQQYLQLQQKRQSDNRRSTAQSNIMKTKHDTAKNAIGNVR